MGETLSRSAELLSRLLRFGDASTRLRLADDVASGDSVLADLLARTARSDEDSELRVRCIEVLGRALETSDGSMKLEVLTSLFGRPVSETVLGL